MLRYLCGCFSELSLCFLYHAELFLKPGLCPPFIVKVEDTVQILLHVLYGLRHFLPLDLLRDGSDVDGVSADRFFKPLVLCHSVNLCHGKRPILGKDSIQINKLSKEGG